MYRFIMTSNLVTRRYRQYSHGFAPRRWALFFEVVGRICNA